MDKPKFFPELNCKYKYRAATISISQISHHNIGWTYNLLVSLNRGYKVEDEQIDTPYPNVNSAEETLSAAKAFAEKWVDDRIIKQTF